VVSKLFWKATLAFLALPGMVAFAIPLLLFEPNWQLSSVRAVGLVPLVAGSLLLLWCVREFYVAGRGTLAPWTPPPVVFSSRPLAVYALAVGVGFHLRVVFGEEPWLARTFGVEWVRYRAQVPRWFGLRQLAKEMPRASG
jgi:protein-S-isoprenylcysteine O-methyltransferase Ste14